MKNPAHDRDIAVSAAAGYLESAGLRILDRTWQMPEGGLDIVAADHHVLVVCQVTTRSRTRPGTPLQAVSQARVRRLRKLAVAWLNAHGMRFEQVRVDIIALIWDGSGGYTIEHVRGVG